MNAHRGTKDGNRRNSVSPSAIASCLLLSFWQVQPASALPAFPSAEGFGTQTRGGRGGVVIVVSNLNGSGPGSFREAMMRTQPRIIVFRVSGVIDLGGDILLSRSAELRDRVGSRVAPVYHVDQRRDHELPNQLP